MLELARPVACASAQTVMGGCATTDDPGVPGVQDAPEQ